MFNTHFERDIIERSLVLVDEYRGQYEVTMLVNCLLGLIVIPNQASHAQLTEDISVLSTWGVGAGQLVIGKPGAEPVNVGYVVRHMRNSLCHMRFRPEPLQAEAERIIFEDRNDFVLEISIPALKQFVRSLAGALKELPQ